MLGHNIEAYQSRFASFGSHVIAVDGHDISQLMSALSEARKTKGKPTTIVAKTFKGKGVPFLEDKEGWHGKALSKEQLEKALPELPELGVPQVTIKKPERITSSVKASNTSSKTNYKKGSLVATREAYGNSLAKLAAENSLIVATDGEVKNSTFAEKVLEVDPKRFVEAYIAEQNMVGMALGMSVKGFTVFASSFAAFLSRAHDQIRMAALSDANLTFVGSHAGVSIGEDGPSQMGLEDIALFRSLPKSIVLYPSDAVSTEKLVELASRTKGLKYIRTTRPKTPIIYDYDERFPLGGMKILRRSNRDQVVVVGAGITVHEALKAYEQLEKLGINIVVADCYCIKPFNASILPELLEKSGRRLLVVEDHYPEGGIGEMIGATINHGAVTIKCLTVHKIPHSSKPGVLLEDQKIDSNAIGETIRRWIAQ
jgi:transketolase